MPHTTPHLVPATHDATTGNPLSAWSLARITPPEQVARELVELAMSLRGCDTHTACIHAQRAVTNTERARDYDLSQPARHAAHMLRKLAELVDISGDARLASLTPLPHPTIEPAAESTVVAEVAWRPAPGGLLCECVHDCRSCSNSGDWHTHPGEPCPVHPHAPMTN